MDGVYMSSKDQRLYQICQDCLSGRLTIKELSLLISKSYRQTQRTLNKRLEGRKKEMLYPSQLSFQGGEAEGKVRGALM
jgi:hypothetical protein